MTRPLGHGFSFPAMTSGDFDYDTHGSEYASVRRPDPRIATLIHAALGDARTVLNVGPEPVPTSRWDQTYAEWRTQPHFNGSLRLVTGCP